MLARFGNKRDESTEHQTPELKCIPKSICVQKHRFAQITIINLADIFKYVNRNPFHFTEFLKNNPKYFRFYAYIVFGVFYEKQPKPHTYYRLNLKHYPSRAMKQAQKEFHFKNINVCDYYLFFFLFVFVIFLLNCENAICQPQVALFRKKKRKPTHTDTTVFERLNHGHPIQIKSFLNIFGK